MELIEGDVAGASFLTLPEPVLIHILKKLPQHDRLSSAALVCQTFAAAAAAATTVISLARVNAATAAGLGSWLQQHGRGAVGAIRVPRSPHDQVQLKLPGAGLPKLQQLLLHNCALEFTSSTTAVQDMPAVVLPALRNIYLNSCKEPFDTLSHLNCPKLTALQVFPSFGGDPPDPLPDSQQQQLDTVLSTVLQRMPELVSLGLGHDQLTALPQLSCLQKLQQCKFCCPQATPEMLQSLSSSLTSLVLMCGRGVLQERDLPAAGWPHLKQLKVSHHAMQPAALSRLTALESLSLHDCVLVPYPDRVPPALQPYDPQLREAEDGAAQLLAALTPLTNLKRLNLTDLMLETLPPYPTSAPRPEGAAAPDRQSPFSVLTASSALESLTLAYRCQEERHDLAQPLPPGAVAALFPPGRQLTALTELVLDAMDPELVEDLAGDDDDGNELETDPYNTTTCMRSNDLPLLLDACPGLQRLTLNSVLPRWCTEFFPFLLGVQDRMQQLTYLCLGGLCLVDDDAPALVRMNRLRELELHNAPELGPKGVTHLTEMRQLSRLLLRGIGHRRCLGCLLVSTPPTDKPDVWRQLQAELPGLREQQWAMQGYDSDDDDTDSYDSDDDDYTDSSDSDGCIGRRGAMCAAYW